LKRILLFLSFHHHPTVRPHSHFLHQPPSSYCLGFLQHQMKNDLKELIVAYFNFCSNICLFGKLSTRQQNVLREWQENLDRPKDSYGYKTCRNHSDIFIRRLTKTSRYCRLLCVGYIISRESSNGNFLLQVADVLEGM
jgi:hypothetical protein